jgi:uncharacterized protein YndB with AHSA1/START domain
MKLPFFPFQAFWISICKNLFVSCETFFTKLNTNIMADIIHRIGIQSTPAAVYNAISTIDGLAHWWTEEVAGETAVGGKIRFTFRSATGDVKGEMGMEVQEAHPPSGLRWICVEGPEEWIGTQISYDLSEQDGQVILLFGHRNWREPVEFMAHCSMKWAVFLLSLREYVETGKGKPSPADLKIDNWN